MRERERENGRKSKKKKIFFQYFGLYFNSKMKISFQNLLIFYVFFYFIWNYYEFYLLFWVINLIKYM